MGINLSTAPPAVVQLVNWLIEDGFVLVHRQSSGVANQFAQYRGGGRSVSVTADRGDWSLTAGLSEMGTEFHPDEWEAWLDRFDLAGELSPLDHQVSFLTGRWASAIALAQANPMAESEIRKIGSDYMFRRFGFRS